MILTKRAFAPKVAFFLAMLISFGSLMIIVMTPSALATHPPETCLDTYDDDNNETDVNPVGTTHTLTATLRPAEEGQVTPSPAPPATSCPEAGTVLATEPTSIAFEVETAPAVTVQKDQTAPPERVSNDGATTASPDMRCVIPTGQHSCTVQFTAFSPGTNVIRSWIEPHTPDTNEPRDETSEEVPAAGQNADEPDETDVVEKTWQVPSNSASRLDCGPESSTNSTGDDHTITCTATDSNGNRVEGAKVDAEAEGTNEPTETSPDSPDYTCTTNAQGQCSFTHGPNGSPPSNSTPTNNEGTTTYRAWLDNDGNDNNTNEGDTTETAGAAENDDGTDVVTKDWRHSPLNCEPETDLNPAGTNHTVTCTARGTDGQPKAGVLIDVEATGTNDPDASNSPATPDFTCTTAGTAGSCTFTHGPGGNARTGANQSNGAGTTTYRAWIDEDGNHSTSTQTHGEFEGDASEGQNDGSEVNPSPSPSPSPSSSPGSIPEPDNTDVVTKTWGASRLDCNPETDRNPTGTAHSIICQARDNNNANVANATIDMEATGANDPDGSESFATPDFSCTTSAAGTCTIVHGPGGNGTTNDSGTTVYTAWIDLDGSNSTTEVDTNEGRLEGTDTTEPDNTDVVEKTWFGSRLDCNPETDVNPAETAHTITCSVTDQAGSPSSGINVDAEATGQNDPDNANSPTSPDFSCTTGTTGQCSFTHGPGGRGTTSQFGKTVYRAWIDGDSSDATVEADPDEQRNESSTTSTPTASPSPTASSSASPSPTPSTSSSASPSPSPSPSFTPGGPAGSTGEPDSTDVVEKNWSAVPDRLTIVPETDSAPVGSCNPFTITALDATGKPVEGVVVDVEQRHERSDNVTANDEPDVSFCVPTTTDGANPSDVDESRGDLGDGSDGATGGEAENPTDAAGKVTIGIRVAPQAGSNGTGNVLVTTFYESEDNDDPDVADPQDTATKTWIASQARSIDCSPETATNQVGTEHTVTCTVVDANGQPAQGEGVTFTEDGPGEFTTSSQTNTNAQGQASATVTSSEAGTQTITGTLTSSTQGEPDADECEKAAGDPSGSSAGACSDSVEKVWTKGGRVTSGPCKNFFQGDRVARSGGGRVIVGTPGPDTLRGTNNNDIICGLGGRDEIRGRGGNDVLDGGRGNDQVFGGGGKDRLLGRTGADRLEGNKGADQLLGHKGNDILLGGAGKDVLKGHAGRDRLRGGGGNDRLDGGADQDRCAGGAGTDTETNCE